MVGTYLHVRLANPLSVSPGNQKEHSMIDGEGGWVTLELYILTSVLVSIHILK